MPTDRHNRQQSTTIEQMSEKKIGESKEWNSPIVGEKKRDNIPIRRFMLIDRILSVPFITGK